MKAEISYKKMLWLLLSGILGCVLMGGSDWLMIYGDMNFEGELVWLTVGAAAVPGWRNTLALALAFPAVIFYALALFGIKQLIKDEKGRRIYGGLCAAGMTPWIALHLFYIMILYLFAFLNAQNLSETAFLACEALFKHFTWFIPAGEAIMLLPFLYLFYLSLRGKTIFKKIIAINNPLLIYIVLKLISGILPNEPFKLAFINGLMSESMLIWFVVFIAALGKYKDGGYFKKAR